MLFELNTQLTDLADWDTETFLDPWLFDIVNVPDLASYELFADAVIETENPCEDPDPVFVFELEIQLTPLTFSDELLVYDPYDQEDQEP